MSDFDCQLVLKKSVFSWIILFPWSYPVFFMRHATYFDLVTPRLNTDVNNLSYDIHFDSLI